MSFDKLVDNKGNKNQRKTLQKLLEQCHLVRDCPKESAIVVEKIAKLALQFRSICREYKSLPLEGVLETIYQEVIAVLILNITDRLKNISQIETIDCVLLNQLQDLSFNSVLNDTKLKGIALLAQKYPANSEKRSHILTELVRAIKISRRLCRPHKEKFSGEFYPLIYEEAVVKTMSFICTNIDSYDPDRGQGKFMSWVNFLLDKEVLRCRREFDGSYRYKLAVIEDISVIPEERCNPNMADLLYQCIERDSHGKYRKARIENNPKGNFRDIALYRLDGLTWKEIGLRVNSPGSTVHGFYREKCLKFKQLIREDLENTQMY